MIGAIDGIAAGFGCSLALACDVRIASSAARLALIFVKRGLALDGGASFFLPRLAGLSGLEMALTGDVVDARTAADWGLVNRVVPDHQLDDAVADLIGRATADSAWTKSMGKRAFYAQVDLDQPKAYAYAVEVMANGVLAAPGQEGIAAFLDKRPPKFE